MAVVDTIAQYRPFSAAGDELTSSEAIQRLIMLTAATEGGRLASLAHCRTVCDREFRLEVDLPELRKNVEKLAEAGVLVEEGTGWRLAADVQAEMEATAVESRETERKAFHDWQRSLAALQPGLTDTELADLGADLDLYLHRVVARHGIEAALVLYPEDERARTLFEEIEAFGIDFLPPRNPRVEAIREEAMSLFIRQPTREQRIVLTERLEAQYFVTVLSIDPSASRLVQEIAAGQRVYLDTNMIYSILNLSGPRNFLTAQRLLELTVGLGYEIFVTPWTVKELKESLQRAKAYLARFPLPPKDLIALASEATTDENFITAYWKIAKDQPVSVDDFYALHSEIDGLLKERKIRVSPKGMGEVGAMPEEVDRQLAILEGVLEPQWRDERVKLHDVRHRLLINVLRGEDSDVSFADAGFWFLTRDSVMPRYDYHARSRDALPACVSTGVWFQIVRSFTPRTTDFAETLSGLLASPYVRYRGRISYATVQKVLSRIDLFKGRTPALAARVMMNSALLRKVGATSDEEARNELIDNAVVTAAQELQSRVERLTADLARQAQEDSQRAALAKQELEEKRRASAEAESRAQRATREATQADARAIEAEDELLAAASELERLRRDSDTARTQASRARSEASSASGQLAEALARISSLEAKQDASDTLAAKRDKQLRLASAVTTAVVAVAAMLLMLTVFDFDSTLTRSAAISAGILGIAAAGSILLGLRTVWRGLVVLSVLLGIVGGIVAIVDAGRSDPAPPADTR